LYTIRKAMSTVGLAETPLHEADRRIGSGRAAVERAEHVAAVSPAEADDLALRGITGLGLARQLLQDVGSTQARERLEEIEGLEARAKNVIVRVNPEANDKSEKKVKADKGGRGNSVDDTRDENANPGAGNDADGSDDASTDDGRQDEGSAESDDPAAGTQKGDDPEQSPSGRRQPPADDPSNTAPRKAGSGGGDHDEFPPMLQRVLSKKRTPGSKG
ncbi:MAG: hypothetical protein LC808_11240, partial [Actinobacteria bacterium]|nr:hypothetical protein [Actinomycetota bacterium]